MNAIVLHDGAGGAGGAERTVVEIANTLDADVHMAYCDIPKEWWTTRCNNDVSFVGISPLARDIRTSLYFSRTKFPEYDVVVTSGPPTKFYKPYDEQDHWHYLHHPPLEHVLWSDGGYIDYIVGNIDRFEARTIPHVISNSKLTAKRAHTQYNIETHVVNPPVNTGRFTHKKERNKRQFVLLGRLSERKRPSVAVEAFRSLGDDFNLIVAGDGPLREQLEKTSPPNVTFEGYVSDDRAEELVETSEGAIAIPKKEDFGITTVEYLAAGTPVVAVNEPNTSNLVEHKKSGYHTPPNPEGVATAVRKVTEINWNRGEIAETAAENYGLDRFRKEIREQINNRHIS